MKFYCTKYWATKGIIEFEGEVSQEEYASETKRSWDHLFLRIGSEAFTSLADARDNVSAKARRNAEAKSRALNKANVLLREATDHKIKVVKR